MANEEPNPASTERERRRAELAAEARRLVADPAYVREAREVATLMERLRAGVAQDSSLDELDRQSQQ